MLHCGARLVGSVGKLVYYLLFMVVAKPNFVWRVSPTVFA
jgi:hypothetical protein